MNPHKTMNGDMAQEGIVLRSPIGAAVRRIASTANGADSDLHIHRPAGGTHTQKNENPLFTQRVP